MFCEQEDKFLNIQSGDFEEKALELFNHQYKHNPVYRAYADALKIAPAEISSINKIPFLPISFFKSYRVITENFEPQLVFESSGTTRSVPSQHYIKNAGIYERSFMRGFEQFYGNINEWCIIGLLPSYLERSGSSLVYMVDKLIKLSGHPKSGFYLYDHHTLTEVLINLENNRQKTLLIGVTYALLDFAAAYPMELKYTEIMETGGMKGRGRELTRMEVHDQLCTAFNKISIHAEYGMTELLSQAYSKHKGMFTCSPTMKVLLREEDDPLSIMEPAEAGTTGIINIIDLANIYSSAFIATDDIGKLYPNGQFEVLGRMDMADMRGCSLMVSGL